MSRMKVLNMTEQEIFDNPPILDSFERKQAFDIPNDLFAKAKSFRKATYKIYFLVECAYFKVMKKFFNPKDYHQRDIEYAARKLGLASNEFIQEQFQRSRMHQLREVILNAYGFCQFDDEAEKYITYEIFEMVRTQIKPRMIFGHSLELLTKKRILLPGSHRLSSIIVNCFNQRKRELIGLIETQLTDEVRSVLDQLFIQEKSSTMKELPHNARYRLTLLKRLSQSTRPVKIKERAADLHYLKSIYDQVKDLLPALELGHEGIRFYATGVIKSDIFQLNQRSAEDRYIHVIAFIVHQYYSLQDNLADVLLTVVQSHKNSATRDHRDKCYEQRKQQNDSLKFLVDNLDDSFFNVLDDIRVILQNNQIKDHDKLSFIQALVSAPEKVKEKAIEIKSTLNQAENDDYNEIIEARSLRLQNRVNPIIKTLDFCGEPGSEELMIAIRYFKDKNGSMGKNPPLDFLTKEECIAVRTGGTFRPSLYKVFLFIHISSALKSGTLNLQHSHKYRSLDDYMISKERWQKEKKTLIDRAQLNDFIDHEKVLAKLERNLSLQYKTTNDSYDEAKNPYLKIKPDGKFTIKTPKQDDIEKDGDVALQSFFPENPVSLIEVLSTVNVHTQFLEEFQHWQHRYTKNRPMNKLFYAGIMGKGCAIGAPKIARISSQINEASLKNVVNWYFSLDNIRAANDRIIKLQNNMALPEIYRQDKKELHTSSDGQKFTVRADSLNANHSFKYFGQEQGISPYTFIDMRNFIWYSDVLNSADRESGYVVDGLTHNNIVKSDIHSTDTHGYSEAIFATTYLIGVAYAPRIKNLKKQTLYTFKSQGRLDANKWGIKPEKYVNQEIIKETWDDVLRLIATIKLKETSASEIFRRLNSYSKQHRLYKGLKAFGQIIKSDFILRYLDDVQLRQAIEKQLNKVELANRFTRDVAVGNPRGFSQGEKEEQAIAEACNRLIKNSIICWNYLYLSDKLERLKNDSMQHKILLSSILRHSVMSWGHFNMLGEYDFSDKKLEDSFNIRPPKLLS